MKQFSCFKVDIDTAMQNSQLLEGKNLTTQKETCRVTKAYAESRKAKAPHALKHN
jgi:hypothetical protein